MDSVTQMVLGAAVAEATIGRKIGNRAILWGAIAGTMPDLDVFVPLGDVVKDFTYHRSASHSLWSVAASRPCIRWSRANTLLQEFHEPASGSGNAWVCPECGETVEGVFDVCWNCSIPRLRE